MLINVCLCGYDCLTNQQETLAIKIYKELITKVYCKHTTLCKAITVVLECKDFADNYILEVSSFICHSYNHWKYILQSAKIW